MIARGNGRRDIFTDRASREHFLRLWLAVAPVNEAILHAFCLMTNHIHLLIQVGATLLGKTMHDVLFRYAQYLHQRYGTDGHVFQDRYKAVPCATDAHLLTVLRYIHRNPVKHGVVDDPGKWEWSSHAAYLGEPSSLVETRFLLDLFGKGRDAVEAYRQFVGATAPAKWPHAERWSWAEHELIEVAAPGEPGRSLPPSALFTAIAAKIGRTLGQLSGASRRSDLVAARRQFIAEARAAGCNLSEIARALRRSPSTIHEAANAGVSETKPKKGTVPIFSLTSGRQLLET